MKSKSVRATFVANTAFFALFSSAIALTGCDRIDLDALGVSTFPAGNGAIIGAKDAAWIEFSEEVGHEDAEGASRITRAGDAVVCDASWDGNRLTLNPVEGWEGGTLYTLSCEGTLETPDGRSFPVRETARFYAISASERAVLLARDPGDDAIVSPDARINLTFSRPLDASELARFVTVSPDCPIERTLSETGTVLTLAPVDSWEGLTRYRWTVAAELRDKEGIPIHDRYAGNFRVQDDTVPPARPSAIGADPDDTAFTFPLDKLERDAGILFRFDEPIDSESFRKRLSVEPAIALAVRALDERSFLACPADSDWRPGIEYAVTIEKGLSDGSGNLTPEDFEWRVTSLASFIAVVSIGNAPATPDGLFEGDELSSGEPLKIGVDSGLREHRFVVKLSGTLSAAEAARLVDSVSLEPVFPFSLSNPSLKSAARNDDGTLTLAYYDLELPDDAANGERAIYRLSIAGGQAGFALDDGRRLESDFSLYLETVTP